MSTTRTRPSAATAHALLIDQTGRMLFVQTTGGQWGLPATVLTFEASPCRQVVALARTSLGIELAERDLLLAHVSVHNTADHAALRLVFSVGLWHGDPATSPAGRRWCDPGQPPTPLAGWDREVLPSLLTNTAYAEIGWNRPSNASRSA
jgi:hypothetical protein